MGIFLQNLPRPDRKFFLAAKFHQLIMPLTKFPDTVDDRITCIHFKAAGHGEVIAPCGEHLTALHTGFPHLAPDVIIDLYDAHPVRDKPQFFRQDILFTEPCNSIIRQTFPRNLFILQPCQELPSALLFPEPFQLLGVDP